ncbi:signal peptidase II [Fulvivirgaceae bacterium LMO-SS25]
MEYRHEEIGEHSSSWKPYFLFVLSIILIDQSAKFWVHFNMDLGLPGQIILIDDWFKIYYTTNSGMAFGWDWDFTYGKLSLSLLRLIICLGLLAYLVIGKARKYKLPISLVSGGAIANLIDNIFYGVWFGNAVVESNTPWFHGKVIDMLYLDLYDGYFASWVPIIGGDPVTFWPVFNFADIFIFLGIGLLVRAMLKN